MKGERCEVWQLNVTMGERPKGLLPSRPAQTEAGDEKRYGWLGEIDREGRVCAASAGAAAARCPFVAIIIPSYNRSLSKTPLLLRDGSPVRIRSFPSAFFRVRLTSVSETDRHHIGPTSNHHGSSELPLP